MSDLYQHGVDPERYAELLEQKSQRLQSLMAEFNPPAVEVHASAPSHFRLRAEFRLWHTAERCFYAMFEPGDRSKVYEVREFPIAAPLINRLMQELLDQLHQHHILRHRLFQVEFLTTLSGDALITLIYHKKLEDEWQEAARQLMATLGFPVIGRSKKQKIVLDRDYVNECLPVDGLQLHYRQIEGGFTQPNGGMNCRMLSWARECLTGMGGDLLELYCGNGNFSIALADRFERVLATEISKTSVAAAQINIAKNEIDNLIIARLSSEEFVTALRGEQQFERLKGVDLASYDFRTVLVDPPRAGLDDESVRQTQGYDNILYISCNPETLQQNLQVLTTTHDIVRLALFDQFPYTEHIETGVLLRRRHGASS
ncbi:tRNA (uridine(54)-C5)-methyltransferase TrmA [Parathalassolituus penaei]|uniref:tRNA/tmRNA (uracil-C(5))-methyltransferase n=1 Tax=Parathalassolituus penaei TaxID=2997323 RepID=A0A9X3EL12_9GAMM|nr:tRNA (uridine(54)-C5)-methyltransferase TrmA [Parathalassolituus penaei]MCY0964588.1 tRNA (uridine(54)-C5)-methyltransferase TrmA [Parathalassolituus penaei]